MKRGFTLAELLIALAILGVIATFTIPKVMQSQQDSKNKSIGKETIAAFSEAYQAYKMKTGATAATGMDDLMPFINYIRRDSSAATVDNWPNSPWGGATWACNGALKCYRLHNGAVAFYNPADTLSGTTNLHAIPLTLDPDGKVSTTKSIFFLIYFDGRVRTAGTALNDTKWNGTADFDPNPIYDPPWFAWD